MAGILTAAQERELAAPKRRGLLASLLTRRNAVGLVVGAAARALLPGLGPGGLLPAAAVGLAGRWAYCRAEQRVPFTSRLHIILVGRGARGQGWAGPGARRAWADAGRMRAAPGQRCAALRVSPGRATQAAGLRL